MFSVASLVIVLVLVAGLAVLAASRSAVRPRDVVWLAGGPAPQDEAHVYARYLERHRRHRAVGGALGVVVALVLGIRVFQHVSIGIGQGNPLGDVLFCGLAGVIVGAFSAEGFRLSEPPSPTVTASLAARPDVVPHRTLVVARVTTLGALLVAGGALVLGAGTTPLGVALAGLALVAVAERTLAAVRGRRRPVLSERAQRVDLRMRTFAGRTVARLELAAAALTAGWVVASLPLGPPATAVQLVAVVGALVVTVVLLRRASPRPPSSWLEPEPATAPAPS